MYFTTGPPRIYAVPPPLFDDSDTRERYEDVAVAMHPDMHVFARVTSRSVTLWSANVALPHPQYQQRHLTTVSRSGSHVRALHSTAAAAAAASTASTDELVVDSDDNDATTRRWVFAVWVTDHKLAVVERGSQIVEFYSFAGLANVEATMRDDDSDHDHALPPPPPASSSSSSSSSSTMASIINAQFSHEFRLNQGDSRRDEHDTAASCSGIDGRKLLFVGMTSGLICVVDVASNADVAAASWFSDPVRTKLWKIDVVPHLHSAAAADNDNDNNDNNDDARETAAACYALACATVPLTQSLVLVACFAGGKCFILFVTPSTKRIAQLLSLVNTERTDAFATSCCTCVALSHNATRLALGWSDGGVSLFALALSESDSDSKADSESEQTLTLVPTRELTLAPWGFAPADVGSVRALAWSFDTETIAVAFATRGYCLFSRDGVRLLSSLPQQQQQQQTLPIDTSVNRKETCGDGVLQLLWTRASATLIVVPRGERFVQASAAPCHFVNTTTASGDLYSITTVSLLKGPDGLCLSLSGAPGRPGAWVRSDKSFTKPASKSVGPAEASGLIHGGDLLLAIDTVQITTQPFERVVALLKALPTNATVELKFMRLKWDKLLPIATQALTSDAFVSQYNIPLGVSHNKSNDDSVDEALSVREYALRMQALHGDCDADARPALLELEQRAKFDGWSTLQGVSREAATHRYLKLLFAMLDAAQPLATLEALAAFAATTTLQAPVQAPLQVLRRVSRTSFLELEMARSVPLSGASQSKRLLIESTAVRIVAAATLDAPSVVTSSVRWPVPLAFAAKCAPLRLAASSVSGLYVAVAGQRGFCVLNVKTTKWRLFGNVNDEQDVVVHALVWVTDDVLLVSLTRVTEDHRHMHVVAYPRNHLDAASVVAHVTLPTTGGSLSIGTDAAVDLPIDGDCVYALVLNDERTTLVCLSMRALTCFHVVVRGSVQHNDVAVELRRVRRIALPSLLVATSKAQEGLASHCVRDIVLLPRLQRQLTVDMGREKQQEQQEETSAGWFSGLVGMLSGDVPHQQSRSSNDLLPRIAIRTDAGDVVVVDPEAQQLDCRTVATNVSTLVQLVVGEAETMSHNNSPHHHHNDDADWPAPCRNVIGLYGIDGLRLWLPLLDGVDLDYDDAVSHDNKEDAWNRLEMFLATHDPKRFKSIALEFPDGPQRASATNVLTQILHEYGIDIVHSKAASDTKRASLTTDPTVLTTTIDDPAARDRFMRFDADVCVVSMHPSVGLLVGVSQDVYAPVVNRQNSLNDHPSPSPLVVADVFVRVQPIVQTLVTFVATHRQMQWTAQLIHALVRSTKQPFALVTSTLELFVHALLEATFAHECDAAVLAAALQLLQTSRSGLPIDVFSALIANVARKSEPTRLALLFDAVGVDPLALLAGCCARLELHTAANLLLVVDAAVEDVGEIGETVATRRHASAGDVVALCVEHDEWRLARHVVRVARGWTHTTQQSIDAYVAAVAFTAFVHGAYARVVRCVVELDAKLPPARVADVAIETTDEAAIVRARLHDEFVATNALQQLRILLQAVTEAKYTTWVRVIQSVMATTAE